MKQTAVDWLAEKYNYITWMRNRDEISAGMADEWRKNYLDQAKEMEKEQIIEAWMATDNPLQRMSAEQYYKANYEENEKTN